MSTNTPRMGSMEPWDLKYRNEGDDYDKVPADFARQLESELSAANERIAELERREVGRAGKLQIAKDDIAAANESLEFNHAKYHEVITKLDTANEQLARLRELAKVVIALRSVTTIDHVRVERDAIEALRAELEK